MSANETLEGHVLLDRKVAAVLPFASKDQTRPILTCVRVTPDHVEATDSYRLIRVDLDKTARAADFPRPNDECATAAIGPEGVAIKASAVGRALKNIGRKDSLPILSRVAVKPSEFRVRLTTTNLERTTVEETDIERGTFPDFDQLIDTGSEPEAVVYLDAGFLRDMAAAVVTFTGRSIRKGRFASSPVKLELFGPTKPVRFSAECDGRKLVGLQMPVLPAGGWGDAE